jgi:four helix bundle protein
MSRDHRKLRVFDHADALVLQVYRATADFPLEERYGLQTQLRRAAISTATNIVEGCARLSTREYVHFLNIANGSSAETGYLLDISTRLGMMPLTASTSLIERSALVTKELQVLISSLRNEP